MGRRGSGLGLAFPTQGNVDHVIVHELAHILDVRASQLTPEKDPNACLQTYVMRGCAKPGSLSYAFNTRFWSVADIQRMWTLGNDPKVTFEDVTVLSRERPNDYVTPYASSNASEDLAESFRYFVLGPKPTDATLVKNQKVLMFYDFPEYVRIRDHIRGALAKYPGPVRRPAA